jgi:hypothetical protein
MLICQNNTPSFLSRLSRCLSLASCAYVELIITSRCVTIRLCLSPLLFKVPASGKVGDNNIFEQNSYHVPSSSPSAESCKEFGFPVNVYTENHREYQYYLKKLINS